MRDVGLDCRLKLTVGVDPIDHSDTGCHACAYDLAASDQLERALLGNRPPQDRHHHCRYEANVDFRIAELRRLSGEYDVASSRQPAASGKRPASPGSDDG